MIFQHISKISPVGDHILTLQASDEDGMMNNEILSVRINGIPSPPFIEITPVNPVEGVDDLYCNIVEDGTDPDGRCTDLYLQLVC